MVADIGANLKWATATVGTGATLAHLVPPFPFILLFSLLLSHRFTQPPVFFSSFSSHSTALKRTTKVAPHPRHSQCSKKARPKHRIQHIGAPRRNADNMHQYDLFLLTSSLLFLFLSRFLLLRPSVAGNHSAMPGLSQAFR